MNVFLDTNVIIDFYDRRREFFHPAAVIMDMGFKGDIRLVVSAVSFVNAFYLLRKSYPKDELYNAMNMLSRLCTITPINGSIVKECLALQADDFEDAIQFKSARTGDVDVIVTRNKQDFASFDIKVQTPIEFLNDYFANS